MTPGIFQQGLVLDAICKNRDIEIGGVETRLVHHGAVVPDGDGHFVLGSELFLENPDDLVSVVEQKPLLHRRKSFI